VNPESTEPGAAAERAPSLADPAAVDPQEIARLRVAIGRLHRRMVQSTSGDLTFSQTSALVAVEQLGPIRLGELAARERVAAPSMTRTVSGLVEGGLLHRAGDPQDGRSFLLSITDRGRHFLEELRTERNAALAQSISHLSESEFDILRAALPVLEHLAQQKA
jgi:DNA-binding MarR family transcriptional regulator